MKNNYPNLTQSDLDVIAQYMDDDLRESIHGDTENPGEFLTMYLDRDTSGALESLLETELKDYVY